MKPSLAGQAKGDKPPTALAKQRLTVSALLFWMLISCLVPSALGVGAFLYVDYKKGLAALEKEMDRAIVAKVEAVDAQLAQVALSANTLVTGGFLAQRDLAGFHQRAVQLLAKEDLKMAVVLFDKTGQQLLHTHVPWGQPLPKRLDFEPIRDVFDTGLATKPALIFRAENKAPMIRTMVPVFSGGQVIYALAVSFSPEKLNAILSDYGFPKDATTTIIDSTGTIAARSLEAEKFVGQKLAPDMWAQLQKQPEGSFDFDLNNGSTFHADFSRSPDTGWRVLMTTPRSSMSASLLDNLLQMVIASVLILALSLGVALIARRRIVNSLNSLKMAAIAYGNGEMTARSEEPLRETNEVAQALKTSALQLLTRTNELRDSNKTLEKRTTELEARTNELKEAQHISKTGSWKWDAITRTHVASDELHRLYGPKILLPFAKQRGTVFPEAAWQELKTAAKAALQTKKGFSLQLPTLTEYGAQIWTRLISEVVCNAAGEPTGLRGTLQDVDVHAKAEIILRESAKRFSALFEESPEAIVVHINGVVTVANTAAATLFGAPEQDLTGASIGKFIHPDSQLVIASRISSITQLGESTPRIEIKLMNKKGQIVPAEVRSFLLLLDGKRYVQTYIRDLTEQKRQEAETAKLRDEMDQLLVWQAAQNTIAALAHEVNQPLASASILSEVAKRLLVTDGLSDEAKAEKTTRLEQVLENIGSDIQRAAGTLKTLFKSLHKPDVTRTNLSMNTLVAESIQTALDEGVINYPIVTDYDANLPAVKVNRMKIAKVLLNLIHNAAQAMQEAQVTDGKIWISTSLTADHRAICVSVRDDGPGISAALGEEVFQPFITTKAHGLGMGLTISRALIEASSGKLWHSQEDGVGATFHFTLPIADSTNAVQDALT